MTSIRSFFGGANNQPVFCCHDYAITNCANNNIAKMYIKILNKFLNVNQRSGEAVNDKKINHRIS